MSAEIKMISNRASEFGAIAKKVNESSSKRKKMALMLQELSAKAIGTGLAISKKMTVVLESDISRRNLYGVVLNYCRGVAENIKQQKQLIAVIKQESGVNASAVAEVEELINDLEQNMSESAAIAESIIAADNNLILLDEFLAVKKSEQLASLKELTVMIKKSIDDAGKAIDGSGKNLKRSLKLVAGIKNLKDDGSKKTKAAMKLLAAEAKIGWQTAEAVNAKSNAQFAFADSVREHTVELLRDSRIIDEFVKKKHLIFEANLQDITVISIIMGMKLKKYLDAEKKVLQLTSAGTNDVTISDLAAYVKIACKNIRYLSQINYDMTGEARRNNVIETQTAEANNKEMKYYTSMADAVSQMTDATRFPVEGSAKNIVNGKYIENELRKML